MMKEFTIYAGEKLSGLVDGQASVTFDCDPTDIDTAYDAVAESIVLKDPARDLITFQNLKDDDVETLLEDTKKHGFISDYEISDSNE